MLDFATIRDDQAASARGFRFHAIGGIEYEEFIAAQAAGVIELHADYYGKFRWSSQQVIDKLIIIKRLASPRLVGLASLLKQAKAAESGIVAQGD